MISLNSIVKYFSFSRCFYPKQPNKQVAMLFYYNQNIVPPLIITLRRCQKILYNEKVLTLEAEGRDGPHTHLRPHGPNNYDTPSKPTALKTISSLKLGCRNFSISQ